MSGICGTMRAGDRFRSAAALQSLTEGLRLSSAEKISRVLDGNVGVGVSARFPTQQIHEDGQLLLACDADLIHLDELRATYASAAGDNATATLLAAMYRRHGPAFVEKLRGAFSVILWDRTQRRMMAAIDGFGIKRLVYCGNAGSLSVASRIDALVRSGDAETTINPKAIPRILHYSANLAPETILSAVQRLTPGTLLTAEDGRLKLEKFWDLRYGLPCEQPSGARALGLRLSEVVRQSVHAHCEGEAFDSLGAFLSGGTDSSTVVGMMSQLRRGPVKAFSIGFEEQSFNELGYASLAAKHFAATHHTFLVKPADCAAAVHDLVRHFDEPTGNSSAIPTYFCARLAAQNGVTTMLAGDGGDEIFGGNEHYRIDKIFHLYHSIPAFVRKGIIEPALALPLRTALLEKARNYVRRANLPGVERMFSFQFLSACSPEGVFESDFLNAADCSNLLGIPNGHYSSAQATHHLDRLLYVDMKVTLADNDLPKVTCMAEMAGIRPRFPFLERGVTDFAGTLPPKYKLMGLEKRYLFKRAFAQLLPGEIIQKKKHGFGIPVAGWMKTDNTLRELSHDALLSSRSLERGYFRRHFIEDLLRKHDADDTSYYGDTVWSFLMLELWHRQFVDHAAKVLV